MEIQTLKVRFSLVAKVNTKKYNSYLKGDKKYFILESNMSYYSLGIQV